MSLSEPLRTIHPDQLLEPKLVRLPGADPRNRTAEGPQLYRHKKRPVWGLAICVSRTDGRHTYQFEDGQLRAFPPVSHHLIEPVDRVDDASLADKLQGMSGFELARREHAEQGRTLVDFSQQVGLFRIDFPEGFADPKWRESVRGGEGMTRLKRHRAPAVSAGNALGDLLEESTGAEVIDRAIAILGETDLVPSAHLEVLRAVPANQRSHVATALRDVLDGEGPVERRMQLYIESIQRGANAHPSWPLATALPALIAPTSHVWVRPTAIREQARTLAPNLKLSQHADGRQYAQLLRLAQVVDRRLRESGLEPCDLIDVCDFMWATLRPAARDRAQELSLDATGDEPMSHTRVKGET